MKVQINGRYAYETDLPDIEIGDEMLLPGTLSSDSWTGVVTALEPDYDGPCRKALGLTRRRAQAEAEREALEKVQIMGWKAGEVILKSCSDCGKERRYVVKTTNNIGRPVSLAIDPCGCGDPGGGVSFGSAASFRQFMIDPER